MPGEIGVVFVGSLCLLKGCGPVRRNGSTVTAGKRAFELIVVVQIYVARQLGIRRMYTASWPWDESLVKLCWMLVVSVPIRRMPLQCTAVAEGFGRALAAINSASRCGRCRDPLFGTLAAATV